MICCSDWAYCISAHVYSFKWYLRELRLSHAWLCNIQTWMISQCIFLCCDSGGIPSLIFSWDLICLSYGWLTCIWESKTQRNSCWCQYHWWWMVTSWWIHRASWPFVRCVCNRVNYVGHSTLVLDLKVICSKNTVASSFFQMSSVLSTCDEDLSLLSRCAAHSFNTLAVCWR